MAVKFVPANHKKLPIRKIKLPQNFHATQYLRQSQWSHFAFQPLRLLLLLAENDQGPLENLFAFGGHFEQHADWNGGRTWSQSTIH